MKNLLTIITAGFLFASLIAVGSNRLNGQDTPAQAPKAGAGDQRPRYDEPAPAKETRVGKYYNVCSADFALAPHQRVDAIRRQLKANPSAVNRLLSTAAVSRPGRPAAAAHPAAPLKLSDVETIQPGAGSMDSDERMATIRQHLSIALIWGQKWPNGSTLHVRFLNTDPSWAPIQAKVELFAHQWEQFANITFAFDDSPEAQIRILLTNDNFSWSAIGTDAQSEPSDHETMHYGWFNLQTPDDEYSRTVIHEFGHALGAIHEHQHPDAGIPWNKDAVYAYYASTTPPWDRQTVDLNMFKKYDRSILQFGAYDKDSIMEYPIPPTFTTNGFSVGWNKVLSAEDKSVIAWLYPKPH